MPGVPAMLVRDAFLRRSLALTDIFAVYLALALVLLLIPGAALRLSPAVALIAPFVVLLIKALGLYDRDQHRLRKTTLDEAPALVHLAFLFAAAIWLAQELVLRGDLSRAQVLALVLASFISMLTSRAATRAAALKITLPERCLIVGSAEEVARTEDKLADASGVNATIVARLSLAPEAVGSESLGHADSLPGLIRHHEVERVIIAPDGQEQEDILQSVRVVKLLGVKVSVLPRLLEVVGSSAAFDEIEGTTLLGVRPYGLSKSSELLKRMTDVVLASIALGVLGPLLVMIALAIRVDSRGFAFFRASRVGRRGDRFQMLKFRTMVDGADGLKESIRELNEAQGGLFKITDDPRITRVGRFLRRTSLDELPQLINVLRGDMSLVGPRPLEPDEDGLIEGWERRRLALPPGMTGLWQIVGSARIPMAEMVKIDYLYGANWSIWLDLKILLRTVPYVLGRRGI